MNADGFFWCERCRKVVDPARPEIEAAENGPSGRLEGIQCPCCHRRTVQWREPQVPRPRPVPAKYRPVSPERGAELWADLKRHLNLL